MTDILNSELLDTVTDTFTLNSDEQVTQLDAAAATLAGALKEHPLNIPGSVLVALDPGIPSDAFALVQAEQHLRVVWKSLSSQHKQRPVGLLRYVLLQSLRHLRDTPDLNSAIHLLARDPVTWIERGREQTTLDKWFAEFSLKPISTEKDSKPSSSSQKPKNSIYQS